MPNDRTDDQRWFEVKAVLKVRAADEDGAIRLISAVTTTEAIPGLFVIGDFSARPCKDPIEEMKERNA